MNFGFLAGTGRTGTHWVQQLIQEADPHTRTVHDGLPQRIKIRGAPLGTMIRYMNKLTGSTVIECNPAMPEWIALAHKTNPADLPYHGDWRSVLMVRHPFGYAKSLLARTWGWQWWKLPGFEYKRQWGRMDELERICFAWVYKTQLALKLGDGPHGIVVRYEDLFYGLESMYLKTVRRLLAHLRVPDGLSDEQLLRLRGRVSAAKGGAQVRLTPGQKDTCWQMCRQMAEALRYGI